MTTQPEQTPQSPSLVPSIEQPLVAGDALAALENALETFPNSIDAIVVADQPRPVGKSYAYDFTRPGFVVPPGAKGPLETRDLATLQVWIEKCLRTARGAHPVYPAGYGMVMNTLDLIGAPVGTVPSDLNQRIRDALVYHPRISDVTDFVYDFEPDDDFITVSFVVHTDAATLPIAGVRLLRTL